MKNVEGSGRQDGGKRGTGEGKWLGVLVKERQAPSCIRCLYDLL
jgi:hypothetical protein